MEPLSKKIRVRIAVGSLNGARSSTWRIVSHKDDIYVSGGENENSKLSFHRSGICRDAFNQEYGAPITMTDRLVHKWIRATIPEAKSGRACLLLRIWIATDFLSTATIPPTKKVLWLAPGPPGGARAIELMLSSDDEQVLAREMHSHRALVAHTRLPGGMSAAIATRVVEGSEKDYAIPASHHANKHLVISAQDPQNTGRPVRMFIGNSPKDGDCKEIWEFGGYYIDGPIPTDIAIFRRTEILATQDTPTVKLTR